MDLLRPGKFQEIDVCLSHMKLQKDLCIPLD